LSYSHLWPTMNAKQRIKEGRSTSLLGLILGTCGSHVFNGKSILKDFQWVAPIQWSEEKLMFFLDANCIIRSYLRPDYKTENRECSISVSLLPVRFTRRSIHSSIRQDSFPSLRRSLKREMLERTLVAPEEKSQIPREYHLWLPLTSRCVPTVSGQGFDWYRDNRNAIA